MWAIIRLVVVLPLVPVTATTGIVGTIVCGPSPCGEATTRSAAWLTASSTTSPGSGVEHGRHRPAHLLGAVAMTPRIGHDDHVGVARRAHPDGEPDGAGLARDRAHQAGDRSQGEPLPEAGVGLTGLCRAQADAPGEPLGRARWVRTRAR